MPTSLLPVAMPRQRPPYGPLAMLLLAAPVLPVPAISFLAHFCWFQRCAATIHATSKLTTFLQALAGDAHALHLKYCPM